VNDINTAELAEPPEASDELAGFPILAGLARANAEASPGVAIAPFTLNDAEPTASQREMHHLALYTRQFGGVFLPLLTEKRLKLDFKFSIGRDGFYNGYQGLLRALEGYRVETQRLAGGDIGREMETELRKRAIRVTREVAIEGARFFRGLERFAAQLAADARDDGVKCLNGGQTIAFDKIEGDSGLRGLTVADALERMRDFAREALAFLNIPEIEIQENERADRH